LRSLPTRLTLFLVTTLLLLSCASPPKRNPLPEDLQEVALIPGIESARDWSDQRYTNLNKWFDLSKDELVTLYPDTFGAQHNYLAISGGGSRGAFAAGLLNGWTAAGNRPEFTVVTGVSTGAIIAPFAFLGSDYDQIIKTFYTTLSTADLIEKRSLLDGLFGDAVADTTPLKNKISEYINEDIVDAIAAEYKRGRSLTIGTTNLDAARPVSWNITEIAASGAPNRIQLIRDIILASASIPAAFPPVIIEVEANGQNYDELHVDGGASSHVYLYPIGVDWAEVTRKMEVKGKPKVFVIRNGHLLRPWSAVKPSTISIASRSLDTLMNTNVLGDMYRIYLAAERDGLEYHLAFIPENFSAESNETFDPVYMTELFNFGFELARKGYPWQRTPPGYDTAISEDNN
jgi:predicted patatin/cPLA2 family phospholipase